FQKAGTSSIKDLEQSRQKVRDKISEKNAKLSLKTPEKPTHKLLKPNQIKPGDRGKVVSIGLTGIFSSPPDRNGKLFVQCGIIRSQVNLNDLVLLEEETVTTTSPMQRTGSGKLKMSKSYSISTEINLLGKTVDEALSSLDKYLDDAYLAHLPSVRIVHGKGTGALRKAVQDYLRRCKYVKSYRQGEYGEGDAGVTIAEFK
ncbi:MAG: Smr/MutS family protein, partial [Lachnospiraceae bacterium]|nr:Smr/MutS family protein [Lachnospiraceae bacterium]